MLLPTSLDTLDRQIAAALQVDGRASWRRIAEVLDVPERTVAVRGSELLRTGVVRVTGLLLLPGGGVPVSSLVTMRCVPGMPQFSASALAQRSDTVLVYVLSGGIDCIAEIASSEQRSSSVLMEELPGIPGAVSMESAVVLKHYKTTHQWLPPVLAADQITALTDPGLAWEATGSVELPPFSREELAIARAVNANGRVSIEELARTVALSPTSVRRRLTQLQESGRLFYRAVVEPRSLGFPIEAVLRIRTVPGRIDAVGDLLRAVPEVRYAAFASGRYQLIANVAFSKHEGLAQFLTRSDWTADVAEVDTSLVLAALKRSGLSTAS